MCVGRCLLRLILILGNELDVGVRNLSVRVVMMIAANEL